jgi:hypothetical protein
MPSARKHRLRATRSDKATVVDAFMDQYVAWRERAGELDVTYRRWREAETAADRRRTFAAFSHALDDEERAARSFGDFATDTARMLSAQQPRVLSRR